MPPRPDVTVVCATFRRPAGVARLVAALEGQDFEGTFDVVISDDGSGEPALSAVRAAVRASPLSIQLLDNEVNRGPGAARNTGWRVAQGEVVAFTDDDCQPQPGWLANGMRRMRAGDVVVVGAVRPDPAQSDLLGPWSRTLTVSDARFFQTANAFYRRTDLEAVGGFDESFVLAGGEDTDLGLRVVDLGRRSEFADDALVLHDVRAGTVRALVRERATKWTDLPLVIRKHPQLRTTLLHRRLFWKRTHPPVIAALVGLTCLLSRRTRAVGVLLLAPWLHDRWRAHPPASSRKQRLKLMPGTFLIDAAEVVCMVRGSVRHRTVML